MFSSCIYSPFLYSSVTENISHTGDEILDKLFSMMAVCHCYPAGSQRKDQFQLTNGGFGYRLRNCLWSEQAQITDSFCLRVMLLKPYKIMALGWCNVLLATILAVQSLKQLTAFINNLKVTKIWNKCLKCFLCLLVFSYVLNLSRNKWWSGMWMYPAHWYSIKLSISRTGNIVQMWTIKTEKASKVYDFSTESNYSFFFFAAVTPKFPLRDN